MAITISFVVLAAEVNKHRSTRISLPQGMNAMSVVLLVQACHEPKSLVACEKAQPACSCTKTHSDDPVVEQASGHNKIIL